MSGKLLRDQSLNLSQTFIGQLLDEFALDQPLLEQLRKARALPVASRIGAIRGLVAKYPDHTPSAIMLLIAMRQAGLLVGSNGFLPQGTFHQIPQRIVQYWDDPEPPSDVLELMHSWPDRHPEFEYVGVNDESAQEFLIKYGLSNALKAYRPARQPAQRADIFRLAYLFIKGGFYVDADDRCLMHLSSFIPHDAEFVAYQEDYGTLANNFIGVVPQHPVIGLALQRGTDAVNRGDADSPWLSTGPGLLELGHLRKPSRDRAAVLPEISARLFSTWDSLCEM